MARQARHDATGEMKQRIKALDGEDTPAAVAAAVALGNLEIKGQPATPALALMLRRGDQQRRVAAAAALGHIGIAAEDYIPMLEAATKEEDPEVRTAAARALEKVGSNQHKAP